MNRWTAAWNALRGKGANADEFRAARVTAQDIGRSRNHGDRDAKAMLARIRNDGFICPLIVARTAAQVPLRVYRKINRSTVTFEGRRVKANTRQAIVKRFMGTKASVEMDSAEDVVELLPGQHPLADLIARPNTMHSGTTYRTVQMFNLLWSGNAYELIDLEGGTPASLFMMPPHDVAPVVEPDGTLRAYSYWKQSNNIEAESAEVVHHMHTVDPTDPFRGFGPLHGVVAQLDTLNTLWDMELARAERNQRPDFHVKLGNAQGNALEELRNYFTNAFSAASIAPRAFFSNSEVEILPLAWSPKDTDLDQRFQRLRKAVWQACGIPESVMELNDANLASSLVSNDQFGRQTIAPLLGAYADDMNEQLVPWYDDGDTLFVAFDDPVPEDNREQLEQYRAEVQAGVRSINEYRSIAGLDPVPDKVGDVLRFNGVSLAMLDTPVVQPQPQAFGIPAQFQLSAAPTNEQQPAETNSHHKAGPTPPERAQVTVSCDLASKSDPWGYSHTCCLSTKENVSDVLTPAEERALDPMTEAISRWYNQNAPAALRASGDAVDMRPYADELEAILDEFLPDLFRNGVAFGAEEMDAIVDDALEVASDAAIEYARTNAPLVAQTAADSASEGLTASVQAAVTQGLERGDAIQRIAEQIPDVSVSRAERIARTEVQEAQQQGKLRAWSDAGVNSKQWLLAGDSCPICNALKARHPGPIPIDEAFLERGETIVGTDGRPFTAGFRAVTAPPAHPNCRCTLVAVLEDDE